MNYLANAWTEQERQYLIDNYPRVGTRECRIALGRSKGSIWQMAKRLGLRCETNPAVAPVNLYPMTANDKRAWTALNNFRAAEPANNGLFWRVA